MKILSMNTVGVGTQLSITGQGATKCVSAEFSKHSESLFPLIEQLMTESGVAVRELSAIGVVTGPGSFTGIRIGLSVAKVMSFANNIPIIGVSALEVLAYNVVVQNVQNQGVICATINAGAGKLYYQFFGVENTILYRLSEPSIMKMEHLEGYLDTYYPEAIVLYNSSNEKAIANMNDRFVNVEFLSESLALCCENNYKMGKISKHNEVMPIYIRDSQAEVILIRDKADIEYLGKMDVSVEDIMLFENQGDSEYSAWNESGVRDYLGGENNEVIVARYKGKLVGCIGYKKIVDEYEIERVAVHKGARLQGVAKCMLVELVRLAKEQNIARILLEVNEKNYPAYRLYSGVGFIQDGIRKDYYGKGKNAILMSMKI